MSIEVNKHLIENILLCDPVTLRGRDRLTALGLEDTIGPKEFFDPENGLWTDPFSQSHYQQLIHADPEDPATPYFPNQIAFSEIEKRRNKLDEQFQGKPGVNFALVLGVVGSGKSIEVQRRVFRATQETRLPYRHDIYDDDSSRSFPATPNAILVDLEQNVQSVTFSHSYTCPDSRSPLWLFCTALLDTLVYYLRFLKREYPYALEKLSDNLKKYFIDEKLEIYAVGPEIMKVFDYASMWASNKCTMIELFDAILELLESKPTPISSQRMTSLSSARADIDCLLRLLYLVPFCAKPDAPKTIIIDNLEDYIAIEWGITQIGRARHRVIRNAVAVSNQQVVEIYCCLRKAQISIRDDYINNAVRRTERSLRPSMTIVLTVRRTSYDLLESAYYGNYRPLIDEIFDITGDTQSLDLWKKKMEHLWSGPIDLEHQCDEETRKYVEFANDIICEAEMDNASGTQQKLSKILARGLRRIGHCESAIIYEMYQVLTGASNGNGEGQLGKQLYINMEQYKNIMRKDAAQYMRRNAFIEYYFQLQFLRTISEQDDAGTRWRDLNIGHLRAETTSGAYYGRGGKPNTTLPKLNYNKVIYADARSGSIKESKWRSLLHRVLCILEKQPIERVSRCIAPLHAPISLFSLMEKLFTKDGESITPSRLDYEYLANVLIAASQPEKYENFAPFVLMRLDPAPRGTFWRTGNLAVTLETIWNAGWKESEDGKEYDRYRYGVRLGEAGQEFLTVWHPSFSFFSALYCANHTPLFFLKDRNLIIHVLNKVYDYAEKVIEYGYRKEAATYLFRLGNQNNSEKEITDRNQKARMFGEEARARDEEFWTYRKQVKEAHFKYLTLYMDYIDKSYLDMGISEYDRDVILSTANEVRGRYRTRAQWKEWEEVKNEPDIGKRVGVRACF